MKFCPKCGQTIAANAKFCRACGTRITEKPRTSEPAPKSSDAVPPVTDLLQETVPPPPARGMQFTLARNSRRGSERAHAPDVSPDRDDTPHVAGTAPPPQSALPGAPRPWKFREQTSSLADSVVGGSGKSAVGRATQGALLHRNIYRHAAAHPELNGEAALIAATVVLAGVAGLWIFGWFSPALILRIAIPRVAGWAAGVLAIQLSAKSMHQINLSFPVWFRALMYAQVPGLLAVVPALGVIGGVWSILCTAAAVHDLTGRDTTAVVVLTVIGGVASLVGAYVVTAVVL
jgi:hypothetical protein